MKTPKIPSILVLVLIMISLAPAVVQNRVGVAPLISFVYAQAPPPGQQQSNATQTNATVQQAQQATNVSKEWWQIGPEFITFSEPAVGLCYPWLVLEHFIVNLPTGEVYPGTGGDSAVKVFCDKNYFVVKGLAGIYAFRRDTGNIYKTVATEGLVFVGAKKETIALYDPTNNVVYVKTIAGKSDVAVPLSNQPSVIDYDIYQGVPIVAYSVIANGTARYYIASPGKEVALQYTGTGALLLNDDTLYIESDGLKVLKILDVVLTIDESDYIPFPFKLTALHEYIEPYLIASSYGIIVSINTQERTFEVVGRAVPTPVGYFVPSANTTYVITSKGIYPVPGIAVALLSDVAAITNVGSAILWPLRTTVFIAKERFDGVLYAGDYAVKISLPPGTYRLPMGAVLKYNGNTILLDRDEVEFPKGVATPAIAVETPVVKYVVSDFPTKYIPVDTFQDINWVSTGGGRAVLLQPDKAIVYSSYGVSAVIPGTWLFGGVGSCVVLYDGASFRLYDFAGNPITSYQYYFVGTPDYATCEQSDGKYVVVLYHGTTVYRVKPGGVEVSNSDVRMYADPTTGLTVRYTTPVEVVLSGFRYSVPPEVLDIKINRYTASWLLRGNLYILSISDATVYTLMHAPENKTFYPLEDYIAMYDQNEKKVEVVSYKSWLVSNCYVNVVTDSDADVYVNNKYVGTGNVTIYTDCRRLLTIEAKKQYFKPVSKTVFVVMPTTVELHPEPIYADVVLNVLAPKNLNITSVSIRLDKTIIEWRIGETKRLIAKPYEVETIMFAPIDVCEHRIFNVTFTEGPNTLTITCELTTSVLALYSAVPTAAKIYRGGVDIEKTPPIGMVTLEANKTTYFPIPADTYVVVSEPRVEKYARKVINATVPDKAVVFLDVTPQPLSVLVVKSTVPSASISVSDTAGNEVASAVGQLEKELLPGTYTVRVMAPGYSPYIEVVELPPGESVVVTATLVPLPSPPPPPSPPPWQRIEFQIAVVVAVAATAAFVLWWRRRRARKVVEEEVSE